MNVLILCDRQSSSYHEQDLGTLAHAVAASAGCDAELVVVNGDELAPCRGCFLCWVKTPGLCIYTDDAANSISARLIRSDAVVLLGRITFGGYSYDLKAFLDRAIPNILPYFEIIDGEMHHEKRYPSFPMLICIGYGDHTPFEAETFALLARRNSLNMNPSGSHVLTIQIPDDLEKTMLSLRSVLSGLVSK